MIDRVIENKVVFVGLSRLNHNYLEDCKYSTGMYNLFFSKFKTMYTYTYHNYIDLMFQLNWGVG